MVNQFMRNKMLQNLVIRTIPPVRNRSYNDVDMTKSQQYFDAVFRHGQGVVGLVSDIEVLDDPKTPDLLKQYIQQHSCRVVRSNSLPYQFSDAMRGDEIVPLSVQTFGEFQDYIANNQIDM